MNVWPIHHAMHRPVRSRGWAVRGLALAFLVVGACVLSSSHPPASRTVSNLGTPATTSSASGDGLEFLPASGSVAELQGSTNVSAWTSRASDIQGRIVLHTDEAALESLFDQIQRRTPPPVLALPNPAWAKAEISVPVKSLHGDSPGMDHDMQKALKAAQYPSIQYVFAQVRQASVQSESDGSPAAIKLGLEGTLSMAGVTRPIAMDVVVRRDAPQHFHAQARAHLLMSDFAVTPPVAFFGLIQAGNEVHVIFNLDLTLHDGSPSR